MFFFVQILVVCQRWSQENILSQVSTLEGHSQKVNSVKFSPDGKRVVSGARDKLVKIWDCETGAEVSSCVRVYWVFFCSGGFAAVHPWFILEVVCKDGVAAVSDAEGALGS